MKKETAAVFLALVLLFITASHVFAGGEKETKAAGEIVTMEMFVNHVWWPIHSWGGSVPEEITRKTGVRLNISVAADTQQLPLMIASGDLPELVFTDNNNSMLSRLADPNLTYSWNQLIKQYTPDFKIDKIRIALEARPDGNFYTIRNNFSTQKEWEEARYALPAGSGLAIREDLLAELGNPPISTLEDLKKVLGMAKARFPGRVPLIMDTLWAGLGPGGMFFADQFGLPTSGFARLNEDDPNSKLVYYIRHPEYINFYKYVNSLYRAGYIIAENYAWKSDDESERYALNDQAFAYMKMNNIADFLNADLVRLGKNYRFKQVSQRLSDKARYFNTAVGWSGVFITKRNRNPAAAINFLKYLYSDEGQRTAFWGIEGQHWSWHPQERRPVFAYNTADNKFIETEGIRWWALFISSAVTEGTYNYNPELKESVRTAQEIKAITVYDPARGMLSPEPDSREMAIMARLGEMVRNENVKIFLASSEPEAVKAYENMLVLADQIGVRQLEDWANKLYQEVRRLF